MDFYKDIDPVTSKPSSEDAFQRLLYICPDLQFYSSLPKSVSTRGHCAADWQLCADTDPDRHVVAHRLRLRLIETAVPDDTQAQNQRISIAIVLEDAKQDAVWIVIPYTSASVVEQAYDSSRAFALQGRTPRGGLHMFGIWFNPGNDAFHFNLALQQARKVMDWDRMDIGSQSTVKKAPVEKNLSLSEGEMITAQPAGMGRRRRSKPDTDEGSTDLQKFALAPPPNYARR